MADVINHYRLIVEGKWQDALTSMAQESWAFGVSLYSELGTVAPVGTPSGAFQAADATLLEEDANYRVESNFLAEGGVSDFNPASYLLDAVFATGTFLATAGVMSSQCKALTATLYPLKPDVRGWFLTCQTSYGPAKAVATPKSAEIANGAVSGSMLPSQNAVAVSLRSVNQTRRGRGRFFLPPTGVSAVGTDGQFGSGAAVAAAAATWLEALSQELSGIDIAPVIIGYPGTRYHRVNRVRVGSVFDTQRRRRRQMTEVYSDSVVD